MSKSKDDANIAPTEAEWWRASELGKDPHEILDGLVVQLEDDQETRYAAYREYARLFGADPDMFGMDDITAIIGENVTQNELANTIETLHAQVFKNRIVPAVSVSEADWEEWNRGRAYSRWLEGMLDTSEAHYDALPRAGMDMFVYGTGFIKVDHDEDVDGFCTLRHHRVDPRFLMVDRLEARNGKPRNLYQKDFVDRFKLASDYGAKSKNFYGDRDERVASILGCKANDDMDMALGSRTKCELVTVREAWHLPTKKGRKDGRHVIWIKGCTLVDDVWDWYRYPFVKLKNGVSVSGGFYGDSSVKKLAPTQKNFDKLNKKIDEAQDLMGVCRIILSRNANITRNHIDDIPGGIMECDGDINNAIREWNATAVAPELYQERSSAPDKMRSLLGVSQFDTQNQLPPALREVSGPALERLVDSGTARHAMVHAELERAVMDLAYLSMDYAAELQEQGKDITVTAPGTSKSTVEQLKFSEVQVDRRRMKLRVQPMSQMPQTFSGKIEAFSKLRENNDIDKQTYLRMLEVPDVAGVTDFLGSDEEIILKNLHFMVKKGKYIPPLQYDNLDLIVPLTTAFINHYRIRDDADMEVVGMLAQYIEDAILLKKGLGGADPMAPPPLPAVPGAMPADPLAPPPPGGAPMGAPPPMGPPEMGGPMPPEAGAPPMPPPMM